MKEATMKIFPFELGPIRPVDEADSLLIRTTRGCPWNQCEFCVNDFSFIEADFEIKFTRVTKPLIET